MFPSSVTSTTSNTVVSMRLIDEDGDDIVFDADGPTITVDGAATTGDGTATTYVGGMLDSAKIDRITIRGYITFDEDEGATLPLSTFEVTVTADVGPTGSLSPRVSPGKSPDIPRFSSDPTSPVLVIDVTSDQTDLVAPYALRRGAFDTGFAISNMTTGPGQSGTIMFQLFQDGEEAIEYETDELQAGATMTILLSEILSEAGVDDGFSGYVKITTNFTGADGIAYISDWTNFSATAALKE